MERCEPLVIVGAGPAGSAAAIALARAGLRPLVLERTPVASPRICGEFISAEAAERLARLGLDLPALGAVRTTRLRIAHGERLVEAALPFTGWGLGRGRLDAALQDLAAAAGARLVRGRRAQVRTVPAADGAASPPFTLGFAGSDDTIDTPALVLACGKSDLAPFNRRPRREPEALVGWQMHVALAPRPWRALAGHVEVMLLGRPGAAPRGYGGLQAVEGGRANLCLLLRLAPDGRAPRDPLSCALAASPWLARRLEGARLLDAAPQTIHRVPFGHVHVPRGPNAASAGPPGLWRLGDQAAVIASFTGDGIAIALHSAALAAERLLRRGDAAGYHRRLLGDVAWPIARAQALVRLGGTSLGATSLFAALARWPALAGWIASATRVSRPLAEPPEFPA